MAERGGEVGGEARGILKLPPTSCACVGTFLLSNRTRLR